MNAALSFSADQVLGCLGAKRFVWVANNKKRGILLALMTSIHV